MLTAIAVICNKKVRLHLNHSKKGSVFFTIDILIAGMVIVATIFIVLSFFSSQPKTQDTIDYLDNYITYISNTRMQQFRTSYKFIYDDPFEPNPDFRVHQKILLLYNENKTDKINSFIDNFTQIIIPDTIGIQYELNGTILYSRGTEELNYSTAQFSRSILTYFYQDGKIIGPFVTRVMLWS